MATIIRIDGSREPLEPQEEDGTLTYEQLIEAVGGGIELVDQVDDEGFYAPGSAYTMYVHEESAFLYPKNTAASRLAGRTIHGPVVYCTRHEAGLD